MTTDRAQCPADVEPESEPQNFIRLNQPKTGLRKDCVLSRSYVSETYLDAVFVNTQDGEKNEDRKAANTVAILHQVMPTRGNTGVRR